MQGTINKDYNKDKCEVNSKKYNQVKKEIGICNLSSIQKITVYGPGAVDLINHYSIRDISRITDNAFYTILMKNKYFIDEVMIIKLSQLKYLIITNEANKIINMFKKIKRKFPMVTIDDTTKLYSLFSFHGEKEAEYFSKITSSFLYRVTQQNYDYHIIIASSVNKYHILDYFLNNGFFEINLEMRKIFLYNNNVITNLKNIKRKFRLNTYITIYDCDNYKFKVKIRILEIKQFESTINNLIVDGSNIYNSQGKCIGYVHNHFRLPNKKNPYILGIVRKFLCEKIALVKHNKVETIIKEYNVY